MTELTVKDLLNATKFTPFGVDTDIKVEIVDEDGESEVCFGKEYAIAEYGDLLVTSVVMYLHMIRICVMGVV